LREKLQEQILKNVLTVCKFRNLKLNLNDSLFQRDTHDKSSSVRSFFSHRHSPLTMITTFPHQQEPAFDSSIPVGRKSDLTSRLDNCYVEYKTYARHVTNVDPDGNVSAKKIAPIVVACLREVAPQLKIKISRAVDRQPITIPNNKHNEKLHGYVVVRLLSHSQLSTFKRCQLLKTAVQRIILTAPQGTRQPSASTLPRSNSMNTCQWGSSAASVVNYSTRLTMLLVKPF
jgi:hypothetical protein